ncbi:MAG: C2 family cysteine protease, partial [Bacillota bacterium]|nr:C2 family cysteine protease [Bacillota bacterium]
YTFKGLKEGAFRRQKSEQNNIHEQVKLQRAVYRDAEDEEGKYSPDYQECMDFIKDYADADMDRLSAIDLGEKLAKARKKIDAAIEKLEQEKEKETNAAKIEVLEKELNTLKEYKERFNRSADGNLEIPENITEEQKIRQTDKMKLDAVFMGIPPFWKNLKDQPLFSHEPSIGDIKQGKIGDCYLQAALASMVYADPQSVKELLKDNGDGTVTVRFYQGGAYGANMTPVYVTVTKEIPVFFGFAAYSRGALWVHMIQKAYAASGLHRTDNDFKFDLEREAKETNASEIKKIRKKYTEQQGAAANQEVNQFVEKKTDELFSVYQYSYRRIEGGKSSYFIKKLTGKEEKMTERTIVTAKNVEEFFNDYRVNTWLTNQKNQDKDNPAYDCIVDIKLQLQKLLKEKYLMKHKDVEYGTKAITIEDVEREVYRMAEWLSDETKIKINENYENYRMKKGSGAGSDNGKMDYYTYLKKIE